MPRPFSRSRKPSLIAILAILIIFALRGAYEWNHPDEGADEALVEGRYSLVRVVDGDTIIVAPTDETAPAMRLDGGEEYRIRLLGIDTPETVKPDHPVEPWGREATAFSQQFLADGQVRLRFGRRRVDKYERYLAYVFVDDAMLNEALVREGLARVSVYPGDLPSLTRQLRAAQDEARTARRGIWSDTAPRP